MTRGNTLQELISIDLAQRARVECENTGLEALKLEALKEAFEKVMSRPRRPVPKLGRPPLSKQEKLKRKLARERKRSGQMDIPGT